MAQHSILVGVDGSEAAKDAVRWAVGAMRDGDILCLVTVSTCSRAVSLTSVSCHSLQHTACRLRSLEEGGTSFICQLPQCIASLNLRLLFRTFRRCHWAIATAIVLASAKRRCTTSSVAW